TKDGMAEVDGFNTVGAEKVQDYVDGASSVSTTVNTTAESIGLGAKTSLDGVTGQRLIGENKIKEFSSGITSKKVIAQGAAKSIASDTKSSLASVTMTTTGQNTAKQYI